MHDLLRIRSIIWAASIGGSFFGHTHAQAKSQTAADSDFQNRCAAAGVVKCLNFDGRSGMALTGAAVIDTAVKASGGGSMRVDIAPTAGEAPGNATVAMGAAWGENSSLYMQWRQRFSPEMIDVNLGGEGFKQFVIYDGQPCGPNMEVAMLNQNFRGFPVFYAACGGSYFRKTLASGTYAHMWSGDTTICTNSNTAACLRYLPNQWMTFYYEQKIGTWGQANSRVSVWMAGENQPLRKFIDLQAYTFKSDNANSAYRALWIGPFSLGRVGNASYPMAQTWIDEFIISNQPIAAPLTASSPIRSPGSATGGKDDRRHVLHGGSHGGLHILAHALGANRFTLSFPNAAQNADISIHDMRGNRVKLFGKVKGNQIQWNASAMRAGTYVVKVHAGNQTWSRKIPILKGG
jgi:Secretion system C-terminal sorting domain